MCKTNNFSKFQIFADIIDGKLFQTISCYKPRSLTTFTVSLDTVLSFIQDEFEVKVSHVMENLSFPTEFQVTHVLFVFSQTYIFRVGQGFVEFTSFTMPLPIKQMIHNEIVTHPTQMLCPQHYLILVLKNQIKFTKAVTIGDCRINEQIKC